METTFKRTIKGHIMEAIFEKADTISVRYYEGINDTVEDYDPEKKYQYKIIVRHPEETDGKQLFDNEVKKYL